MVKKNPDYDEAVHDLAQLITPAFLMRSKVTKKSPAYLQYFHTLKVHCCFFREYLLRKKSTMRENDFIVLFYFSIFIINLIIY